MAAITGNRDFRDSLWMSAAQPLSGKPYIEPDIAE
jgi:hypothetical protein